MAAVTSISLSYKRKDMDTERDPSPPSKYIKIDNECAISTYDDEKKQRKSSTQQVMQIFPVMAYLCDFLPPLSIAALAE